MKQAKGPGVEPGCRGCRGRVVAGPTLHIIKRGGDSDKYNIILSKMVAKEAQDRSENGAGSLRTSSSLDGMHEMHLSLFALPSVTRCKSRRSSGPFYLFAIT